uniref:RING-type domain-containing protein n=1 Tax=Caenorhabditis japonica TaxID=281687 RepID=A0A8R1DQ74_CAEJA
MVDVPGPSNIGTYSQWSDVVECPICYNIYDKPMQMACGHTICSSCVGSLVEQVRTNPENEMHRLHIHRANILGVDQVGLGGFVNQIEEAQFIDIPQMDPREEAAGMRGMMPLPPHRRVDRGTYIKCPECRMVTFVPIDGLPVNYRVQEIVAKVAPLFKDRHLVKHCNTCKEVVASGVYWNCKQCTENSTKICSTCMVRLHNGHEMEEIRILTSKDVREMQEQISKHAQAAYQALEDIKPQLAVLGGSIETDTLDKLSSLIKIFEHLMNTFDNKIEEHTTAEDLQVEVRKAKTIADVYKESITRFNEKLFGAVRAAMKEFWEPFEVLQTELNFNIEPERRPVVDAPARADVRDPQRPQQHQHGEALQVIRPGDVQVVDINQAVQAVIQPIQRRRNDMVMRNPPRVQQAAVHFNNVERQRVRQRVQINGVPIQQQQQQQQQQLAIAPQQMQPLPEQFQRQLHQLLFQHGIPPQPQQQQLQGGPPPMFRAGGPPPQGRPMPGMMAHHPQMMPPHMQQGPPMAAFQAALMNQQQQQQQQMAPRQAQQQMMPPPGHFAAPFQPQHHPHHPMQVAGQMGPVRQRPAQMAQHPMMQQMHMQQAQAPHAHLIPHQQQQQQQQHHHQQNQQQQQMHQVQQQQPQQQQLNDPRNQLVNVMPQQQQQQQAPQMRDAQAQQMPQAPIREPPQWRQQQRPEFPYNNDQMRVQVEEEAEVDQEAEDADEPVERLNPEINAFGAANAHIEQYNDDVLEVEEVAEDENNAPAQLQPIDAQEGEPAVQLEQQNLADPVVVMVAPDGDFVQFQDMRQEVEAIVVGQFNGGVVHHPDVEFNEQQPVFVFGDQEEPAVPEERPLEAAPQNQHALIVGQNHPDMDVNNEQNEADAVAEMPVERIPPATRRSSRREGTVTANGNVATVDAPDTRRTTRSAARCTAQQDEPSSSSSQQPPRSPSPQNVVKRRKMESEEPAQQIPRPPKRRAASSTQGTLTSAAGSSTSASTSSSSSSLAPPTRRNARS